MIIMYKIMCLHAMQFKETVWTMDIYFFVEMEYNGNRMGRQIHNWIMFIPFPLMILMYSIKLCVNNLNYWDLL